jgi:hypothetical protein
VTTLQQKLYLLENRLDQTSGPVTTVQRAHISQHDDTNTSDTTSDADDIINIVVPDESMEAISDTLAGHIQPPQQDEQTEPQLTTELMLPSGNADLGTEFRLPTNQRKRIRRGNIGSDSTREQTMCISQGTHRIQASCNVSRQMVYVGNLDGAMSDTDLRAHMRDIGVTHVTDVIQLNGRNNDRSSFCISIDNFDQESVIYNVDNWPQGVRPYKGKRPNKESHNNTPRRYGYYHDEPPRYRQRPDRHTPRQDHRRNHQVQLQSMSERQDLTRRHQEQRRDHFTEPRDSRHWPSSESRP